MLKLSHLQWIALLSLLSVLPLWLIPIAPLTDWPTHLAISRETFVLLTTHLPHAFYYLDFSFLGYSLVDLLLVGLQFFVSLNVAGQLALTLLFLLAPLGWWYFFKTLDPSKQDWAVLGILANYTVFFYWGNISFLFAVPLGLVWLALGLKAFLRNKPHTLAFVIAGAATYLAHAYVFLMLGGLLVLIYAYQRLWKGRPASVWTAFALLLILLAGLASAQLNPTHDTSRSYYDQVMTCAQGSALSSHPTFNSKEFTAQWLLGVLSSRANPFVLFNSVFPFIILLALAILILLPFGLFALWQWTEHQQTFSQTWARYGPQLPLPRWNLFFLSIALLLYIHYLIVPSCAAFICDMGQRSLPFAFAFLALAVDSKRLVRPVFHAAVILVLLNIAFQAFIFIQAAPAQASILSALPAIAAQLPPGSAVFIVPSNQTALYQYSPIPPYPNTYYQALLVADSPSSYVSGLYGAQDTFLLRSRFPLFDDMVHFGPQPSLMPGNASICYAHPPSQYNYLIDEQMRLRPNP